jgi:hypothetical protein
MHCCVRCCASARRLRIQKRGVRLTYSALQCSMVAVREPSGYLHCDSVDTSHKSQGSDRRLVHQKTYSLRCKDPIFSFQMQLDIRSCVRPAQCHRKEARRRCSSFDISGVSTRFASLILFALYRVISQQGMGATARACGLAVLNRSSSR